MENNKLIGAVFWRHGHKNREHELIFDPPLLENQNHLMQHVKYALNIYGPPDIIVSSPLIRTIETSKIIQNICKEFNYDIEIVIDKYLHECEESIVDSYLLSDQTQKYYPNGINENKINDLPYRLDYIINNLIAQSKCKLWIITHGSLIKNLALASNFKLKRIEEGSFIYLTFKQYEDNCIDDIINYESISKIL